MSLKFAQVMMVLNIEHTDWLKTVKDEGKMIIFLIKLIFNFTLSGEHLILLFYPSTNFMIYPQ